MFQKKMLFTDYLNCKNADTKFVIHMYIATMMYIKSLLGLIVIYMYISIDADVPACINCLHLCKYEDMYTDNLTLKYTCSRRN